MNSRQYKPERLPIWRDSQQLLLQIEVAVRGFPRYHKYTVGAELRRQAMRVCQILSRAIAAHNEQRIRRVQQLLEVLGDLKITVQLAKELKAFASFRAFGEIAELTVAIGKQGGAWLRHLSSKRARPASQAG